MSVKHPIIAVTGASGAGTTVVQQAFKEIFHRQGINAGYVQGNGFLRYSDKDTEKRISQALADDCFVSCYGPELNDFSRLESCFRGYADKGLESLRYKVSEENHHLYDEPVGEFTEWQTLPADTDCLFYEGMHGGVVAQTWTRRKCAEEVNVENERRENRNKGINVAQHVDLLIGVVPAINLEWIQRIHHDQHVKKHSPQQVTTNILEQLQDYIHFIVPQFSVSDINFQRMPVVDTSNPFDTSMVPTEHESIVVVSFKDPAEHDLASYVKRIEGAVLSQRNSLSIPGGQMQHALDVICAPLIEALIQRRA